LFLAFLGGTDNAEDVLFSRKHTYQIESETGNSVDGFPDVVYHDSSILNSLSKQNPTGTFYKVITITVVLAKTNSAEDQYRMSPN